MNNLATFVVQKMLTLTDSGVRHKVVCKLCEATGNTDIIQGRSGKEWRM